MIIPPSYTKKRETYYAQPVPPKNWNSFFGSVSLLPESSRHFFLIPSFHLVESNPGQPLARLGLPCARGVDIPSNAPEQIKYRTQPKRRCCGYAKYGAIKYRKSRVKENFVAVVVILCCTVPPVPQVPAPQIKPFDLCSSIS